MLSSFMIFSKTSEPPLFRRVLKSNMMIFGRGISLNTLNWHIIFQASLALPVNRISSRYVVFLNSSINRCKSPGLFSIIEF